MADLERLIYRGTTYWVQKTGRYFQSREPVNGERMLHRRVWVERNGPIPPGHEVHHRDGDWRNNEISNLEAMLPADHDRLHAAERSRRSIEQEREYGYLKLAQIEAAKWHRSEEGREWHREHALGQWQNKKPTGCICARCGASYWSFFPTRSRFCSRSCEQAEAYRRYFTDLRACDWCGKQFVANRHRKTACCSRECSNRKRAADARL